jgi:lipoprotein-anchoring transpeptidase ErfK/SrfK
MRSFVSTLLLTLAVAFGTIAGARAQVDPDTRQPIGPVRPGSGTASAVSSFATFSSFLNASPIPRQTVSFPAKYSPGTVVVNTTERRLYYVLGEGQALRYGIGVGRIGFTWAGTHHVTQKREWPDWTPPPQMLKRRPDLPKFMKGGPDNPLGARAIYLGSSLYRIHGSNEPETIGQAVSSGCFRMTNDDVIDLYNRVKVGSVVHVTR